MTRRTAIKLSALALGVACGVAKPEGIAYDADTCAWCRMQISDPRFAALLLTAKGRTMKFDSVECLLAFYKRDAGAVGVAGLWVSNFRRPGSLIDARTARFVDLGGGRSPMGGTRGLAAVATAGDAAAIGATNTKAWAEL